MKQQFKLVSALFILIVPALLQGFSPKPAGGDHFKVLLNGKTVTEQFLTQPVSIKSLTLSNSNRNDRMSFYYSHCGQVGTGRVIVLTDAAGTVLKRWKFEDGGKPFMDIPVKEFLGSAKEKSPVSVQYYSEELPRGRVLIRLNLLNGVTV